jgi:hypothetical protein
VSGNASAARAHVQLFANTPSSPVRWRLLSGNNREIGRSVDEFADAETCRLAIKDLQNALDELTSSVRRTVSNEWTWELTRGTAPVAVSGPRGFDRMIRCKQGLSSFLLLVPDADIGTTSMVSHARRWESPSAGRASRPPAPSRWSSFG